MSADTGEYAIGSIKIDGIEPTSEFKAYAEKEKCGEATAEDARRLFERGYNVKGGETND